MTISTVFMICDAYESGVGHGRERSGPGMTAMYGNYDHQEAYEIGYRFGQEGKGFYVPGVECTPPGAME